MSGTRPDGGPRASSTSRVATSPVSMGWNRTPAGTGITGSFANCRSHGQRQVVKLGGTQRCPRQSGIGDDALRSPFGREVAEHGAVDPTNDRYPIGADNRDVHKVLCAGPCCRPYQRAGLVLVALGAAGAVDDGLDPGKAASIPSPVVRSPIRNSTPSAGLWLLRLSTRTLQPASRRRGTIRLPSVPVPPVSRMADVMAVSSWLSHEFGLVGLLL